MNHFLKAVICLSVLMMLASCTSSYENKGNKAYKASQKAQGDAQRLLKKEAYIHFRTALKKAPEKVTPRLRNRFIEVSLFRANMVLNEGSANMDALPLLLEDIDSTLNPEVDPELKTLYANLLTNLADSSFAKQKTYEAMEFLDKAMNVAVDKSPIQSKKEKIVKSLAEENFVMAETEFENGKDSESHESLIRAEFLTLLTLYYDKDHKEAQELLSKLRKKNVKSYSAYEAVVHDKPDSTIYYSVNKYDILLAVPTQRVGGSRLTAKVMMYNYSYNPLKLRPSQFSLVDVNGNKYQALPSSKMGSKEFLDQEHETEMLLIFPRPKADVKKLVYENDEHYSEKYFF